MEKWNRASPSQLKTFADCKKKWYYNKILGLEAPSTTATDLGDRVHKYIENYLQDKEQVDNYQSLLTPLSFSFLDSVKTKNPQIEMQFVNTSLVVPVAGRIDLFWIDGKVGHVVDHKTTSNLKWALTKEQLIEDPQAIIYSAYIFDTYKEVDVVEFCFHYITTKGKAQTSIVAVSYTRSDIVGRLVDINEALASMVAISSLEEKEVPKNTNACYKFGACPYQNRCLKFSGNLFEEVAMATIDLGSLGKSQKNYGAPIPTLFVGCRPVGKSFVMLEVFAQKEIDEFCAKEKLPHYTVDPYNKGPRVVAGAVWYAVKNKEKQLPELLVIDPVSPLGNAFISLLHEDGLGANLVVNGVR